MAQWILSVAGRQRETIQRPSCCDRKMSKDTYLCSMNHDDIEFYKGLALYILPDGVTNYFDLVDFCEEPASKADQLYKKELHLYLDERDNRPDGFAGVRPNGFTEEKKILDFPVRNRRTVLHLRRRRWLTTDGRNAIVELSETAKIAYEGTAYSKELALFLKRADGQ